MKKTEKKEYNEIEKIHAFFRHLQEGGYELSIQACQKTKATLKIMARLVAEHETLKEKRRREEERRRYGR
ncbi:MAG: hypothetical protein LUF01_10035 [Bacteroides sp.]|nr:hypothetical protein [Bacteroides sp.]